MIGGINITINRGYHLLTSTFFVSIHRTTFSLFLSHSLPVISCQIILASYFLLIFLWPFSETHGFVIFSLLSSIIQLSVIFPI